MSPPAEFEVEYDLGKDVEVSVTIVGPDGAPLRQSRIKPGQLGGRKGKNLLSLWDGRDAMGREAAPGPYHAIIVEAGPEGAAPQSRVIPLRKGTR